MFNFFYKMKAVKKIALLTGITGQDGSYLTEFLLSKGYKVYGLIRRTSNNNNTKRINHLMDQIVLMYGDMTDSHSIISILQTIKNNYEKDDFILEIYNLAAQSHVKISFDVPEFTANVDALGTLRILEAIRITGLQERTRFYQASTSEMFGLVQEIPQSEKTPFYPRSPYGVAKVYAHWIVKNYRESYGMYACSGILFNHESPRRGKNFVTRKITIGLGKILRGEEKTIVLGNLDATRDWGHAKDFVKGMWLMLQQDQPDDYVLATGEEHSVREFVEKVFKEKQIDIVWHGEGVDEVGKDKYTGKILITVDKKYYRPAEVEQLLGDSTKARTTLGWKPEYTFDELVKEMVVGDC